MHVETLGMQATDSVDSLGFSITQGPQSMESLTSSRWASLLPSPPPLNSARVASPPHTLTPLALGASRCPTHCKAISVPALNPASSSLSPGRRARSRMPPVWSESREGRQSLRPDEAGVGEGVHACQG